MLQLIESIYKLGQLSDLFPTQLWIPSLVTAAI
jgi:hypothetical protein